MEWVANYHILFKVALPLCKLIGREGKVGKGIYPNKKKIADNLRRVAQTISVKYCKDPLSVGSGL